MSTSPSMKSKTGAAKKKEKKSEEEIRQEKMDKTFEWYEFLERSPCKNALNGYRNCVANAMKKKSGEEGNNNNNDDDDENEKVIVSICDGAYEPLEQCLDGNPECDKRFFDGPRPGHGSCTQQ
ncbi:hypothetical protein RIF29_23226 [Crotalaria pallida]|uniref:Uncharacterized protein n=1 Tax=Crotalaria pallida TaxID=3830 RepID=A0AAN9F7H5_CROPI